MFTLFQLCFIFTFLDFNYLFLVELLRFTHYTVMYIYGYVDVYAQIGEAG